MNIIKKFNDGSFLEYAAGSFDSWCVYYTDANGNRNPPHDIDYFTKMKELSNSYGAEKVYSDFVFVYNNTNKVIEQRVLVEITELSKTYPHIETEIDVLFTTLYMAMIAEENKQYTRLGKRIKRLGVYKVLYENADVYEAANFMKGKGWKEIDVLCKERGF